MTHDESESSMKMNSEKNKNKLTLDTTDLGAGNPLTDMWANGWGSRGGRDRRDAVAAGACLARDCHYFFICHHLIAAARKKQEVRSTLGNE